MKKTIIYIFSFYLIFILAGCGLPPPKDSREQGFLSFMENFLKETSNLKNVTEMRERMKQETEHIDFILVGKKNDYVDFVNKPIADPSESEFIYHEGNNTFVFKKDIYITEFNTKTLFSLDGKDFYTLFSKNTDLEGKHENVLTYINFNVQKDGSQTLEAPFEWRMSLNNKLLPGLSYDKSEILRRPLITINDDKVFMSSDKNKINASLAQYILFIPKDTRLHFVLKSEGNLFDVRTEKDLIRLGLKSNIYFYRPSKFLASFSFDGKNWGFNISNFKIRFNQEVYSKNKELYYEYYMLINYNK